MTKTILNLALIAGLGLSLPVLAQQGRMANEAVVGDAGGQVMTDSSDECVHTSSWTEGRAAEACGDAPEPVAVVQPPPEPKVITETTTLSAAALFAFDSDVIKADARPELDHIAERVRGLSSVDSVSIVGHTDSVGSDAYNEKLSMRRANAVKRYLTDDGVDAGVMSASGMGESQPVADNRTSEGRAQNRRVEVVVKGTETR
jgi:OOP family OmpA-OmpF porin